MLKQYKLNKSELTRLKHEEKIYLQFLPVLKLKQEQLQIENLKIKKKYILLKDEYDEEKKKIDKNIGILTDSNNSYDIITCIKPIKIDIKYTSLVGISVPILHKIYFKEYFINLFDVPYWFLFMIKYLRIIIMKYIELQIVDIQYKLVKKELKKATQKVNLFDKVLIPETKNAIKKIKISLGDEQVAAVGRAKIAKNKNIIICKV